MRGDTVNVTIRAYEQRDAADLADVFFRSVRQVAVSDYTPAQVQAWAPERRTAAQAQQWIGGGRLVLLPASENDRAVAFIDLEPDGHIDHIFWTWCFAASPSTTTRWPRISPPAPARARPSPPGGYSARCPTRRTLR
jgi:hypothetical protein